MIKIACIGNMNNNLFSVTRYLRKNGYCCDLLLLDEQTHFLPKADTFKDDYKSYTKQLDWTLYSPVEIKSEKVASDLKEYSYIIACGIAPAYLASANIKLDMFISYGSDIIDLPFYRINIFSLIKHIFRSKSILTNAQTSLLVEAKKKKTAQLQLKGIQNASVYAYDLTNEAYEKKIRKVRMKGERLKIVCPFIFIDETSPEEVSKSYSISKYYKQFKEIRDQNQLVVFHHCRHSWKTHVDKWNYKANDKLLRGFAQFVKKNRGYKAKLILFEYGPDVIHSKELIKSLGIENYISWFPIMERKEIMIGISLSDLGVGELGVSWFSYGAIYEFMSMAKPVMHYRNDKEYEGKYPQMYPMYNANSDKQVYETLTKFISNPAHFSLVGKEAQKWFYLYGVNMPILKIIESINKKCVALQAI